MTDRDRSKALKAVGSGAEAADLARLRDLLDSHGAEEALWPAAERPQLARLMRENAVAAHLVAETRAFESVLASAPANGARHPSALADLIVATARTSPRLVATATVPAVAGVRNFPRREPLTARWREAAVLAASLLVGVSVGASETVGGYVRSLAAEVGVASEVPIAGLEDLWASGDSAEGIL